MSKKEDKTPSKKEDKTSSKKEDKTSSKKEDKTSSKKEDKTSSKKEDKTSSKKEDKPSTKDTKPSIKDKTPSSTKDNKPSAKDNRPSSKKEDTPSYKKDDKPSSQKESKPSSKKEDKPSSIKEDKPLSKNEPTKSKSASSTKPGKPDAIKSETPVIDEWFEGDLEEDDSNELNTKTTDSSTAFLPMSPPGLQDTDTATISGSTPAGIHVIQQPALTTTPSMVVTPSQPEIPGMGKFGPKLPGSDIAAPGVVFLQNSSVKKESGSNKETISDSASKSPSKSSGGFKRPDTKPSSKTSRFGRVVSDSGFKVPDPISTSKKSSQDQSAFKTPASRSSSRSSKSGQSSEFSVFKVPGQIPPSDQRSGGFKVPSAVSVKKKDQPLADPFKVSSLMTLGMMKPGTVHGILGEDEKSTATAQVNIDFQLIQNSLG